MAQDGLNSLAFRVVKTTPLMLGGHTLPESFHYHVDISGPDPA